MQHYKVAILIDGGFFVQMFKKNNRNIMPKRSDVERTINGIMSEVQRISGGNCIDDLFRTFYYDCPPFGKTVKDMSGRDIDFSKKSVFTEQTAYLNSLRFIDQFALRLGELSFSGWKLKSYKPQLSKPVPDIRQKGVDMKIGLDMAWMAGKRTVDKIVLVTGDSDFISPMKLVRREGILVYLYPMGSTSIKTELREHTDFTIYI